MKALTLWQPWASLVALGVKTIETRSWPAPKSLIGQRIAIHASVKRPTHCQTIGSYQVLDQADALRLCGPPSYDLGHMPVMPLGAVVATAVLTDCVPMVASGTRAGSGVTDCLSIDRFGDGLWLCPGDSPERNVTDQRPYGDYQPGRWAWLLDDVKPTTKRCPACWGEGLVEGVVNGQSVGSVECGACHDTGRCDPIPAKGRQGVWEATS